MAGLLFHEAPQVEYTGSRSHFYPSGEQESNSSCYDVESQHVQTGEREARHEHGIHEHQTYDAWNEFSDMLWKRDKEHVEAWVAEVDSLLTFAGLFLTVITLFISTSSGKLQPDSGDQTVDYLRIIAMQLNATQPAHMTLAIPAPFKRDLWDVVVNSLLFSSLLCCLISSGMGLWVKEWLREYLLDLPYRPRELVHVQEFRHHGLKRWHMREMIAAVSFALQLAVVAFSAGITMMVAKLDPTLNLVLLALLGLWTLLTWGLSIGPVLSTHCPFKSPLALALYQLRRVPAFFIPGRKFETIVERELHAAQRQATRLEGEALVYVNREYWGDSRLQRVNTCFKDMKDRDEASRCIEELIAESYGWNRSAMIAKLVEGDISMPKDDGVLHLLQIWGEIKGIENVSWGSFTFSLRSPRPLVTVS